MSQIYLYDDEQARRFEPFALTRPVSELRAGAELIRRRWVRMSGLEAAGFISAPHLQDFQEFDAPAAATGDLPAGTIVANSRCVPALAPAEPHAEVWTCGGEVAAVRLRRPVAVESFEAGIRPLGSLAAPAAPVARIRGWWLREVWDLIGQLTTMLADDIEHLVSAGNVGKDAPPGTSVVGPHPVYMENGASVEPMVFFDTSAGPVLVREGASVHAFSRIIGPAVIGRKSSVVGGRVAAVSIGEVCKVSGEMSNTIMLGHSNKGHDGFVGHSYMGRWVNLGAGTTTSNLKNTYGAVPLWTPDGIRDTGQQFLGTMFGDHAKTGIGTQLNTGTVLGAGANVFGGEMPPKYVPPFSWGDREPYGEFEVEKFLKVAERMMARRHVTIGDGCREQLRKAHGLALVRRRRRAEGA